MMWRGKGGRRVEGETLSNSWFTFQLFEIAETGTNHNQEPGTPIFEYHVLPPRCISKKLDPMQSSCNLNQVFKKA